MAAQNYESAISLIDEAHAQDPNIAIVDGKEVPYELHYAQKSTHYLSLRYPDASPIPVSYTHLTLPTIYSV